jgi:hypothetical protein
MTSTPLAGERPEQQQRQAGHHPGAARARQWGVWRREGRGQAPPSLDR